MRTIIATAPIAAIVIMGRTGAKPEPEWEPVRIVMHHAPPPPVPRDPIEPEIESDPPEEPEEAEDKQTRNARIIAARGAGASLGELAERFGMSRSGIQHILRG